jgi:hypothetical protein
MGNCFQAGGGVLIALIPLFYIAGFSVLSLAGNQAAGKEYVTLKPCYERAGPKGSPVIELALFAGRPRETGSCEDIKQIRLSNTFSGG